MKANSDRKKSHSQHALAQQFHRMASDFLSGLGFDLDNEPTLILSPYQLTIARYRSSKGFYIEVSFDPADTNTAEIYCGRKWHNLKMNFLPDPNSLSGSYSSLNKLFGFDIKGKFKLGYGEEIVSTMEEILTILKQSLPLALERTTLQDLLKIERESFGAEGRAKTIFGEGYKDCVDISQYDR